MAVQVMERTANRVFYQLAKNLIEAPDYKTEVRGLKTLECINQSICLIHPYNRIITLEYRNISMSYLIGEFCLYLKGSNKLSEYTYYSKFWNKVSDDDETINSDYGHRIFDEYIIEHEVRCFPSQIEYAIGQLKGDKNSRKAVMVIYDKADSVKSKDNPCTLSIQFLIRNNFLYCINTMRSNDLFFGFTYDMAFFTFVQEIVFTHLKYTMYPDLKMGMYYHNVGSMHLYEKDFDAANKIIEKHPAFQLNQCGEMPRLVEQDIKTWFKDLIHYERVFREIPLNNEPYFTSTPFQEYGINILKEKRDGIISNTNITK